MTQRRTRNSTARLLGAGLLGAGLMLTPGCGEQANRVTIFAAASLTNAFEELAHAFERQHPESATRLHFAGTTRLVMQLREGAPADVFASADAVQMQRVLADNPKARQPQTFASNKLVIITAKDNPHGIASLADLQEPGVATLLCGPDVPAGRYAREAMQKAGVTVTSKSDEPSVRAVLSKVQLGLVDAGIVYATDANDDVHTIVIPADQNVTATYPIVALETGNQEAAGAAFVAFVMSEEGQRILASHGFAKP